MKNSQYIRNALVGDNISFAEMNIPPKTAIQHMSHRELEAELVFHIGHAKSIHIAAAISCYSRREKPFTGNSAPGYQPGSRSKQVDAKPLSWVV